jgi:hypothetical protein
LRITKRREAGHPIVRGAQGTSAHNRPSTERSTINAISVGRLLADVPYPSIAAASHQSEGGRPMTKELRDKARALGA